MSGVEWVGSLLGLASVWLTGRQSLLGWPVGLLWAALYVGVFYQARLYSQMGLSLVYCGAQFYGWARWAYGGKGKTGLPVTSLPASGVVLGLTLGALASLPLAYLASQAPEARDPLADAAVTAFSLVAQFWMAHKRIQCWSLWVAVNLLAVGVFLHQHLWPTAALYTLFLGLAWEGRRAWRRDLLSAQ